MSEHLDLPVPSSEPLKQAPLDLVVCQVQHDRTLAVGDASRALNVAQSLEEAFGERLALEDQQQHEIGFAAQGQGLPVPITPQQVKGWRIVTKSGSWVVALMPDFFALECTGYTSWADFRRRFSALVQMIAKEFHPAVERRLGLRYVDRIESTKVSRPSDWKGYIEDELLGPLLSPSFGGAVSTSQQLLQLRAPNDIEVLLRHGTQQGPDGRWQYMLDTDCYRAHTIRFEEDSLISGTDALHKLAVQVFQSSITKSYRERMERGEE